MGLGMQDFNLSRWNQVWLTRGMTMSPVPGTGMIDVNGVQGFLIPGDVGCLLKLAMQLPGGGNYLEVGSWMGLSSILVANGLLAALNLGARVWCIDTWEGSAEHQNLDVVENGRLFETFVQNVKSASVEHFIRPVRGRSVDVARSWDGPPFDIVFIDGDHSAEACYEDIRAWAPHLRTGGRLLGHDAAPGSGVRQALERYRAESGRNLHILPPPTAHYIWEASV